MKKMLAVFGMVVLAFTVIALVTPAPVSAQNWSAGAWVEGGTSSDGYHFSSSSSSSTPSYRGSRCVLPRGNTRSASSVVGNEANQWGKIKGEAYENRVDRVTFEGKFRQEGNYQNNAPGIRTSGRGIVSGRISGDSGRR